MKTLSDIVSIILKNAVSENQKLREHAQSLLGPRTRGSTTDFSLEDLPLNSKLEPCSSSCIAPGCRCFYIYCPDFTGLVKAVSLEEAWYRDLPVKIRDGEHGLELYVDQPDIDGVPENHFYFIVGDYEGEEAVFTWHPGPPLSPLSEGIKPSTAVKLHNG